MTYLELVRELVVVGGIAGQGGPVSVEGQTGEYARAATLIKRAYQEVCALHADWAFLWAHHTEMVSDKIVEPPAELATWNASRISVDGERLDVIDWRDMSSGDSQPSVPCGASIRPDNSLHLLPEPDQEYELTAEYWKHPAPLTNDEDEPLIPIQFRYVIVGRALILLGNYEYAEDLMKQGQEIYQNYLAALERHQLPRMQQHTARHEGEPIVVLTQ